MIQLGEHAEGVVLPIRAQPRAKKSAVQGEHAGALKVAVTAPPQDGRANEAMIEVVASALGIKRRQVALLTGATSRDKALVIRGLTCTELEVKLQSLLKETTDSTDGTDKRIAR